MDKVRRVADSRNLLLRRARVFDASEVLALINGYASSNVMLPRDLSYFYENVRYFAVIENVGEETGQKIVSCGSLHVLSKDTAEIRGLAVQPQFQRLGMGSKIVRYFIEEGRHMGIEKILAFTLKPEFFEKLGFKFKTKEELPSVVFSECLKCPKYAQCDEIAFIFDCDR